MCVVYHDSNQMTTNNLGNHVIKNVNLSIFLYIMKLNFKIISEEFEKMTLK